MPSSQSSATRASPLGQYLLLAAINLLQHDKSEPGMSAHWTPGMLCKASGLNPRQLQTLVEQQIITIEEIEVQRDPLLGRIIPYSTPLSLTIDQQEALEQILGHKGAPILLHGITGSGKTEVYLQALAAMIARGRRGIVLV